MSHRWHITWIGLLLLATTPVTATTGFSFLRLGEGARAAAMGDATVALLSATADAANPAALQPHQQAVTFSHTNWIEQIQHEYIGALWGRGQNVLAISARLSRSDGLERRVSATQAPLGEFGVYEWTAGFAWSRQLSKALRAGIGLRLARQSIFADAATGGYGDVGLLYQQSGWSLGAAVRNVGTMGDLDRAATDLPTQFRLGVSREAGSLLLALASHWTDKEGSLNVGGQWRATSRLQLRAGYQTGTDTRELSFGAGVNLAPWFLDYAYIPFDAGFGSAHRVSLRWSIDTALTQ